MFTISNNNIITMSRGDEFTTPIFINWGTQMVPVRYKLQEYDILYFNLYEPNAFEPNALLRKIYTYEDLNKYGDVVLDFKTENTIDLLPGLYYYEIKILRRVPLDESSDSSDSSDDPEFDSVYNTVVPRTIFFIVE